MEYGNIKAIKEEEREKGKLLIVSTPIGNIDDISRRAERSLVKADIVVCEEYKVGAKLLKLLNINKKLEELNEQNEPEKTQELVALLLQGKHLALISDAGTPLFADPGIFLVRSCLNKGIPIEVVPGASSIMVSLVRSGFNIEKFFYAGFLSRERSERFRELKRLSDLNVTVAFLETPYRLMPVLEAAAQVMPDRKAYLGFNLTTHYETHHYGTFSELFEKFKEQKVKAEFVVVFQGNNLSSGYEMIVTERAAKPHGQRRSNIDYRKPREGKSYERRGGPGRKGGDYKSGDRDFKSRDRDYKPGDRDFKSKDRGYKSGDRDFKSTDRDYKSGGRDYKSGGRDYKSGGRREDDRKGGSARPYRKNKNFKRGDK